MLCSRGKYMLMVDADGATKFSDFAKMEEKMLAVERNGEGVIVGSRSQYHPEYLSEKVLLFILFFQDHDHYCIITNVIQYNDHK